MMKKILLSTLLMHFFVSAFSQSEVTFYDFNSNPNDGNTATGILLPVNGSSSISTIGGTTQTFVTGNSLDLNLTDNSGLQTTGYPAQSTMTETAGIQINVDATGKNNLTLDLWQRLSNSASNTWKLQYTADNTGFSTGGTVVWTTAITFTFTPQPNGTGDTWYQRLYNFSAITALNNNATVGFRIVSAFDPITGQYVAARSTSSYATSGTSRFDLISINESAPSATIASASNFQIVQENAGTIQVPITVANANNSVSKIVIGLSTYTDASINNDFSWTTDTLTIPALSNGIFNFPLTIIDDNLAERAEKIIVKIVSGVNIIVPTSNNYQIIYVRDNDYLAPTPTNELNMNLLSSFSNGTAGTNSAEIVTYDSTTFRLYIANSIGQKLDIVDFSNPASPILLNSVSVGSYGNINSVVAYNGIIAMAIENTSGQANGSVVFVDADGNFINQVTVGAMPDMICFNKDHSKILTANEGEPNATYTADPEGSVSIIDLSGGIGSLTNANVTTIGFTDYNSQAATLIAQGIRVFSTSASVAQDFEPEYITISSDNTKAFVVLQENNAMVVIDIATSTIDTIYPLGYSDYSAGNGMDASDQSTAVLIGTAPVQGAYMPDAIAYSTINGQGFIFSANEGDSREFGSVVDAARISTLTLDSTAYPDQNILKNNRFIGRLSGLRYSGDTDNDGDLDQIHTMGGRSFSIWSASTGQLVFDSKDLIEQITSNNPATAAFFNASNSSGAATFKNRSDDKGPEPEGVSTAFINGSNYLFVSLERVGGVLTFNVNDPSNPIYVGYYNNRTIGGNGPDLGAEGIIYISAEASPNGNSIVILANEVSSTLSIYQVNTCAELSASNLIATAESICEGESTVLSFTPLTGTNFNWILDNQLITNQTTNSYTASTGGEYKLYLENSVYACSDSSNAVNIVVNNLPMVSAVASDSTICLGQPVSFSGEGATTYAWDNNVTDGVAINPTITGIYTVVGTDVNGCENTDDVAIVVNNLPMVSAVASDSSICLGQPVTLSGEGATTYAWDNNVTDGVAINPTISGNYTVIGTDVNGCENADEVAIVVNNLPMVSAVASDSSICLGQPVTLSGEGATTYAWNNSVTDGVAINPSTSGIYSVTGTDLNGCENTDDVSIVVNALPIVNLGVDITTCDYEAPITLNAGLHTTYSWNSGETTSTLNVSNSGTYTVIVSNIEGCTSNDEIVVNFQDCAGIEETEILANIYPNPTSGTVNIDLSVSLSNANIQLIDLQGKILFSNYQFNGESLMIDLNAFSNGMYFLQIEVNKQISKFKLIKK